jgi:hypothetical protein
MPSTYEWISKCTFCSVFLLMRDLCMKTIIYLIARVTNSDLKTKRSEKGGTPSILDQLQYVCWLHEWLIAILVRHKAITDATFSTQKLAFFPFLLLAIHGWDLNRTTSGPAGWGMNLEPGRCVLSKWYSVDLVHTHQIHFTVALIFGVSFGLFQVADQLHMTLSISILFVLTCYFCVCILLASANYLAVCIERNYTRGISCIYIALFLSYILFFNSYKMHLVTVMSTVFTCMISLHWNNLKQQSEKEGMWERISNGSSPTSFPLQIYASKSHYLQF